MEKERKFKTIGIIAVIVAIIGLSVAFAALSQTLTINGSAKNLSSTWSIVWEEIDNQTIVPSNGVGVQSGYPKLDNVSLVKDNTTQITGVNLDLGEITLHKPGDNATFRINIANKGDINAKITGVVGPSVNNAYVDYSVKYLDTNTNVTTNLIGRLLEPEERKLVIIEVKFKDVTTQEYSQIPSEGITVSLNGVSITYTQDDGTGIPDPEPEVSGYAKYANTYYTTNEDITITLDSEGNENGLFNQSYEFVPGTYTYDENDNIVITVGTMVYNYKYSKVNGVGILSGPQSLARVAITEENGFSYDLNGRQYINGTSTLRFYNGNSHAGGYINIDSAGANIGYVMYDNIVYTHGREDIIYDSVNDTLTYNNLVYTRSE